MARAHEVAIAADAKGFDQGIRSGVIKPLEEAEKALDDLADAADDAGRDGSRGIDKLEDALKDAQREAKDLGDAGDDAGDDIKKGMRRAEEGVEDFKQEAQQSIRETAASFSDITDAADLLQEVAANAFSGFGPAGMIAGTAAAIGIGAAVAGFEAVGEAEEESRARAAEWASAYVEAGSRILSTAMSVAKQTDIATDPEMYAKATENAKNWGVDVSVAIAAMAGETWALNAANDNLTKSQAKIAEEMRETGTQLDWTNESLVELSTRTFDGQRAFDELSGEMQRGAEQAAALSESLKLTARNTDGAKESVDEFGDTVVSLPDGTTIYIDAETGQATADLDLIEKKVYAMPSDKEITATIKASVDQAQRDLDGFFVKNGGREIKIKGKVVTDGTWQ